MSKLLGIVLVAGAIWLAPEPGAESIVDAGVDIPECVLASQWVSANVDALPTTLEAFGEHSATYRRAIYGALDSEARISLWREHLAAVTPEVTSPEQRLFLDRVSRELEGHLRGTAPRSELEELAKEATATLGVDMARRALTSLGAEAMPGGVTQDPPDARPDCTCVVDSDLSPVPFNDCLRGVIGEELGEGLDEVCWRGPPGQGCEALETGCGLWDEEPCDGRCWQRVRR